MKGIIISFDVSKGNCHYQGFKDPDTPFTKPKILYFKKTSFKELEWYVASLKEKFEEDDVSYVFESTGVYHQVLRKYLDEIISSILSSPRFYQPNTARLNFTPIKQIRSIAETSLKYITVLKMNS